MKDEKPDDKSADKPVVGKVKAAMAATDEASVKAMDAQHAKVAKMRDDADAEQVVLDQMIGNHNIILRKLADEAKQKAMDAKAKEPAAPSLMGRRA